MNESRVGLGSIRVGPHRGRVDGYVMWAMPPVELSSGQVLYKEELERILMQLRAIRASGVVNMCSRLEVADVMCLIGADEEAEWLKDKAFSPHKEIIGQYDDGTPRRSTRTRYLELLLYLQESKE